MMMTADDTALQQSIDSVVIYHKFLDTKFNQSNEREQ